MFCPFEAPPFEDSGGEVGERFENVLVRRLGCVWDGINVLKSHWDPWVFIGESSPNGFNSGE